MYNSIDSMISSYSRNLHVSYSGGCSGGTYSGVSNSCSANYSSSHDNFMPLVSPSYSFFPVREYSKGSYLSNFSSKPSNYFSSSMFVNPYANKTMFVDDAEQIKDLISEAFEATTGKELPNDIMISVCDEKVMRENHPGWHPGIEGFAFNHHPKMVFVKKTNLANVMVVMGHELGHVYTAQLDDGRTEEAKAFAFCIAWIRAIKEKNIGNLSRNLSLQEPANNGLHDVALDFVLKEVNNGIEPLDLFWDISLGKVCCT